MFESLISLTSIALLGVFILLVLIIVTLGRRIRRIRVSAGVITVLVEFGLTPEELEAEVISSLVRLRAMTGTDTEFRILAEPILNRYLSSSNSTSRYGGYIEPRVIQGRTERVLNYPPPPPPRPLPAPPPPPRLPSPPR